MYLKIECNTARQASRLSVLGADFFEVSKKYKTSRLDKLVEQYALKGYEFYASLDDLKKVGITDSDIIIAVKDLTESKPKAKQPIKEEPVSAVGLSVNKFLEQNPSIRTKDELAKYYTMDIINKAEANGVFLVRKGKLIF
jgi:hypothetical protein